MQRSSQSNQPKTTKFDVFMLSDADVAFLNNQTPKTYNEETPFEINESGTREYLYTENYTAQPLTAESQQSDSENTFPAYFPSNTPPGLASVSLQNKNPSSEISDEPLFINENNDPNDLVFSSVSETRFYQPRPGYDSDILDDVINKIVVSEPLLTEDDLLFLTKKEYTGHDTITRKLLRQALKRNQLFTGYQRLQAYMNGVSYE